MPKLIGSPCVPVAMTSCTSSATARVSKASASRPALAARRARGASIGRPKKLMPDQREEALQRLDFWRDQGCCGKELWPQQGYG